MSDEEFMKLQARAHSGQWDFDEVLRWYGEALERIATLEAERDEAREEAERIRSGLPTVHSWGEFPWEDTLPEPPNDD